MTVSVVNETDRHCGFSCGYARYAVLITGILGLWYLRPGTTCSPFIYV